MPNARSGVCKSNKDAQGLAEDVVWYSRNKQIRVEFGVQVNKTL